MTINELNIYIKINIYLTVIGKYKITFMLPQFSSDSFIFTPLSGSVKNKKYRTNNLPVFLNGCKIPFPILRGE